MSSEPQESQGEQDTQVPAHTEHMFSGDRKYNTSTALESDECYEGNKTRLWRRNLSRVCMVCELDHIGSWGDVFPAEGTAWV